jgi:hypothetical protein
MFAGAPSSARLLTLKYAIVGVLSSWSFATLAVGAKNMISSVPRFMVIETAFTLAQWLMVAPLTALVFRGARVTTATIPSVPVSR